MDFDGYEPLRLTADEVEMLKALRHMADKSGYEYGMAAQLSDGATGKILWKSDKFTSNNRNLVVIPQSVLQLDTISLYHAHTNNTLFSVKDLKLLLRPNVKKVCVIAASYNAAVVWTNSGCLPDDEEFTEVTSQIQRTVPLELLNRPDFFDWTQEERMNRAIQEQAFQISRHFKWTLEGGTL